MNRLHRLTFRTSSSLSERRASNESLKSLVHALSRAAALNRPTIRSSMHILDFKSGSCDRRNVFRSTLGSKIIFSTISLFSGNSLSV